MVPSLNKPDVRVLPIYPTLKETSSCVESWIIVNFKWELTDSAGW
jgi:hypothetical protein